jgi:hypothetical protein
MIKVYAYEASFFTKTLRRVTMSELNHPEEHVMEEPSNDFMDTAIGFAGMFGFLFLMGIVATAITLLQ